MKNGLRLLPLAALLMLAAPAAQAQIHKCTVNGKTTYQAAPCDTAGSSASVAAPASGATQGARSDKSAFNSIWNRLKAGMSADEVKRLIAGAEYWDGPTLDTGNAKGTLRKRGLMFAGQRFDVGYYFRQDRLFVVTLTDQVDDERKLIKPINQVRDEARHLQDALQKIHGTPFLETPDMTVWRLPNNATVNIKVTPVGSSYGGLAIGILPGG